jgi:hypothetical protein
MSFGTMPGVEVDYGAPAPMLVFRKVRELIARKLPVVSGSSGSAVLIRETFTDLGGFRPQSAGPVFQRATA